MPYSQIDRSSYIPFYIQVLDAIKEQIDQGEISSGEQLPGEPELCRIFDVSRTVIRQALKELEIQGLIVREKGRGTFVAEPKIGESLFQELTGFFHDMETRGHRPVSEVLKQEVVVPSQKVASYLNLDGGAKVIQIDRLRFVQDEPIVLVTTFLPFDLCPDLVEADLSQQSLYAYLEHAYDLRIVRGTRSLEAVPATEHEAELLNVKKGAPLILLDSVSYLADGTALEYYHALHRGDRSRFEVSLIRLPDTAAGPAALAEEAIRQANN